MTISANKSGGCRNGHPPILAVANNLLIQTGNCEEQRRKCEQSNSLEMPDFTGFSALRRSAGNSEENGKNDLLSGRAWVQIPSGAPSYNTFVTKRRDLGQLCPAVPAFCSAKN